MSISIIGSGSALGVHLLRLGDDTSVKLKVTECGDERSMGPICLDTTTLRCPIIGIPDGGIDGHGLIIRERDAFALLVLVNTNGSFVNEEHHALLVP